MDNPQIVLSVVVEHIHGMTPRAVQIARQLLDFYFNETKQQGNTNSKNNPNTSSIPDAILPAPTGNTNPTTSTPQKRMLSMADISSRYDDSMALKCLISFLPPDHIFQLKSE